MTKRQIVLLAGDKMPDGYKSCGYKNCFEEQCKGNCTFPEPINPMKETEQTLLDQIKDGVAVENGSEDWHAYDKKIRYTPVYSLVWKQVCERYSTAKAKASCEATLRKASESAKCEPVYDYSEERAELIGYRVKKSSITDPNNIVIVP